MPEYRDGSMKSVKVISIHCFAAAILTMLWFGKVTEAFAEIVLVPTYVGWLIAHVVQQKAKLKAIADA